MPLSQATFAAVVLEDTDGRWEIHRGKLREKPDMSFGHNETIWCLAEQLMPQLAPDRYRVRQNAGHLKYGDELSYIPDVIIVPVELTRAFRADPRAFEAYTDPLPFVVEVWSPSTGAYDIDAKIPGYQRRGDAEIWRIHPFERTVTVWRRQSDGAYAETRHTAGVLRLAAIPSVTIDLDELFRER
jgi:Uma2 family endonuclease